MLYKVFLMEDEVITREGIRDNVDWQASGFEFCSKAANGEMTLPLLRMTQPNLLITDIKMPFMNDLPLSKIAQRAINPGHTSHSLKPISVQKPTYFHLERKSRQCGFTLYR